MIMITYTDCPWIQVASSVAHLQGVWKTEIAHIKHFCYKCKSAAASMSAISEGAGHTNIEAWRDSPTIGILIFDGHKATTACRVSIQCPMAL